MRIVFLIGITLILTGSSIAQQAVERVDAMISVKDSVITNTPTNRHISVRGTKFSIIPPAGFIKAPNFFGFQQPESGSSILFTNVKGSFEAISQSITKENLLAQGMELESMEHFTLNGFPALFLSCKQQSDGAIITKYSIFCGSNEQIWIINGVFHKDMKEIGKEINKSMLTVYYDPNKRDDEQETIDFEIKATGTRLIYVGVVSGSLIYSSDGKMPSKTKEKTYLIASKSFSNTNKEDEKLFCLNRIKTTPFELRSIDSINEVMIDGISGYEIIASAKNLKMNEDIRIYQTILFSDDLYYIILGSTNQDFESNLNEFRKMTNAFKRK
ncbi:MAG: hypothetical protein ACO1N0_10445 [Fluviicola sp.]